MAKTADTATTISWLSAVRLTTQVVVKRQPAGVTVRVGSVIDFDVSASRLKVVVPPTKTFSTTVGVKLAHVSKNVTVKVWD